MAYFKEYYTKLPEDIQRKVLTYYWTPQPKALLADIKNYHESLDLIKQIYHNDIITEYNDLGEQDPHPDPVQNWLINDIHRWLNNDNPTMYGYIEKFKQTIQRYPYYHLIAKNIDSYIEIIGKTSVQKEIQIFWGLFTPKERCLFINHQLSFLNDEAV